MRVAIYTRVSTERQARAESIEDQVKRLQAHVTQQGWELALEHLYRDNGYSGANLTRPGLDALRQAVAACQVQRVLITAPDRLSRVFLHQALLIEEMESHGCAVEFLDRPMSKEPDDQLLLHVRGAIAEYERTLILQRTRRGRQRKLEAGLMLPWTVPPYGYRANPDHPSDPAGVSIDEAEAAVVREIYARYLAPEGTVRGVAQWLTGRGIPSPSGKTAWHPPTVRAMLTNPTYTGKVYAGRFQRDKARTRLSPVKVPIGSGKVKRPQPQSAWMEVAKVPVVVSEEEFATVQAKLARNRERSRRNNKSHAYLLRALVSCGGCGSACTGQTTPRGLSYYRCKQRSNPVAKARGEICRMPTARADMLDSVVWDDLCALLTHPEAITWALQRAHGGLWLPHELRARRDMLNKGKASAARQVERLTDAYVGGIIGLAEYGRRRKELEAHLEALAIQERQLLGEMTQRLELEGIAQSTEAFCIRVRAALAGATTPQKRQLVELLIDRVIVKENEVEIRYVIPTTPASEHVRFDQLRTPHQPGLS